MNTPSNSVAFESQDSSVGETVVALAVLLVPAQGIVGEPLDLYRSVWPLPQSFCLPS